MHNPASFRENEKHELQWDFEIQTDHQISAKQTELVIINKKKRELAEVKIFLTRLTTE